MAVSKLVGFLKAALLKKFMKYSFKDILARKDQPSKWVSDKEDIHNLRKSKLSSNKDIAKIIKDAIKKVKHK